jgi:hypothetical protein
VLQPRQQEKLTWVTEDKEHAMSAVNSSIAVIGIDIGKNSFHVVGQDERGAIVLRQKWSRGQVEARLANLPASLVGMEACVGAHHLSRKLRALGHDARLMPAKYVRLDWDFVADCAVGSLLVVVPTPSLAFSSRVVAVPSEANENALAWEVALSLRSRPP